MTPDEFQSSWRSLATPSVTGQLEAIEVSPASGVWIATDHYKRRHLLIQVPDGADFRTSGTHGLGVTVARHRIPDHADAMYIDMVCLDDAVGPTFAAVAADICSVAVQAGPVDRVSRVTSTLNEWRWFWGVDPTRLSATDAIGLFGELWFLIRWVGVTAESVEAWEASSGSRHDFQWPERSVEIKATSRAGSVVHSIQHLEQLEDAETGDLYLYSLRLVKDTLAANTLGSLVDTVTAALREQPEVRGAFLAKLGRRGFSPASREQSTVSYRIAEESLYRVTDGFPRLTNASFADGLPTGVMRVSYQLDMAACAPWLEATTPHAWPPPPRA